jgi:hypothetical protein
MSHDESSDHERCTKPDGLETDFRLEVSIVSLDITLRDSIVEPVTTNLTENGSDDWRKVKETNLFRPKVVEWSQKYCESCVDADYPGECEAIVDNRKEDGRFYGYTDRTHTGLAKGVAKMARAVLRYADELLELGTPWRLIDRIYISTLHDAGAGEAHLPGRLYELVQMLSDVQKVQ